MALFDHSVRCECSVDPQLGDLMVTIYVEYVDAFGVKREVVEALAEPNAKKFDKSRIVVGGTATTGARIVSGGVLGVRGRVVDILSGANYFTCQWIDKEIPEVADVVNFFESLSPIDGSPRLLATARDCLHPQLVSMNIMILNKDKDMERPLRVIRMNPFTGEQF